MNEIIEFFQSIEAVIYFVLGILGLFYIRRLFASWKETKKSTFGLERESTQRVFNASLVTVVILALIALSEFIIVSFVAPSLPKKVTVSTPTIDLLSTMNGTITPADGMILPTMTLPNTSEGCVTGKIEWTSPAGGERISGKVTLRGLVKVIDLGFYKYEYSFFGSGIWTTIAANTADTFEATWDVGELPPGDYQLRLLVLDTQNRELPPCIILVNIAAP